MSDSTLVKFGSRAWGIVVGVIAFVIVGFLFFHVAVGLLSLAIWLAPLPLSVAALLLVPKQFGNGGKTIVAATGATLCFPWARFLWNQGESLPTWLALILTFGMSPEPFQGPRGPEIHDVASMMGNALVVSAIGIVALLVGVWLLGKELLGIAGKVEPPAAPPS